MSGTQNSGSNSQIPNQMSSNPLNPMNYSPEMLAAMLSSMQGGMPMGMNSMNSVPGLSNLAGLTNTPGLGNLPGLNNLLGLNGNSLNNLARLSGMMPNMGNFNSFSNPLLNNLHHMQGLQGMQSSNNMRMNELLRNQIERNNQGSEKEGK